MGNEGREEGIKDLSHRVTPHVCVCPAGAQHRGGGGQLKGSPRRCSMMGKGGTNVKISLGLQKCRAEIGVNKEVALPLINLFEMSAFHPIKKLQRCLDKGKSNPLFTASSRNMQIRLN